MGRSSSRKRGDEEGELLLDDEAECVDEKELRGLELVEAAADDDDEDAPAIPTGRRLDTPDALAGMSIGVDEELRELELDCFFALWVGRSRVRSDAR